MFLGLRLALPCIANIMITLMRGWYDLGSDPRMIVMRWASESCTHAIEYFCILRHDSRCVWTVTHPHNSSHMHHMLILTDMALPLCFMQIISQTL